MPARPGWTRLSPLALAVVVACADAPSAPTTSSAPALAPAPEGGIAPALAVAQAPLVGCVDGTLPSGALSRICFPPVWNGDAVFWAHGYVSPFEPLALPDDRVGPLAVQDLVLALGFAYATTSYRNNGLAAAAAVGDLTQLAAALESAVSTGTGGSVRYSYLIGASEGGLATALTLERAWEPFDGGLVACGPTGSFRRQVNYFGDVRVLFDAFFPGVLPGSAIQIPADLITNWETVYEPAVRAALQASPSRMAQLVRTAQIALDPSAGTLPGESILAALWYNIFATNDARARLGGGNPFDNRLRWYSGSDNDLFLNLTVRRFSADAAALSAMNAFETGGNPRRPTQAIHTKFDPVIPFWQAILYQIEGFANSGLTLITIPSSNYGHCAFDIEQVLASFAVLILRVTGGNLLASTSVFPDEHSVARFHALSLEGGAAPVVMTPREISLARLTTLRQLRD